MRIPILALLSLDLLLAAPGCEKNVQEVRREKPDIVAPGSEAATASHATPVAPAGEAVAPSGKPLAPSGAAVGISGRAATPLDP